MPVVESVAPDPWRLQPWWRDVPWHEFAEGDVLDPARDSSGKSPGNHGRSSFGVPNGGLEDQQKVEKVLDFSCIYDIT